MHIPDGFLDTKTLFITNTVSYLTFFYSGRKILKKIEAERVPILGLSTAFIFLISSISFPLPFGTSIHLLGSFFISLILGPFSAFFINFLSLFLQSLLLSHGGILTLGANSINIAFSSCILGFYFYKFLIRILPNFENFIIFIITIFTAFIGSFLLTLELNFSGKISFQKSFLPIISFHLVSGSFEGLFTVFLINFIKKLKPKLLEVEKI
ncbi:MAG: energy-coupling factor ABC transporter permease [Candidatus Hydrothermales bacterium]